MLQSSKSAVVLLSYTFREEADNVVQAAKSSGDGVPEQ